MTPTTTAKAMSRAFDQCRTVAATMMNSVLVVRNTPVSASP